MSTLRARVIALWAILVALAPLALPAQSRLFCRAMERVVDTCCCGHEKQRSVSETRVQAPDCCTRLAQGAALTAATPREVATQIPAAGLLATLTGGEVLKELPGTFVSGSFGEPRAGPALKSRLFLEYCVLLI
jgi:hypothetical protein